MVQAVCVYSWTHHGGVGRALSRDVWWHSSVKVLRKSEESRNDGFGILACQTDSETFVPLSSVFNVAM